MGVCVCVSWGHEVMRKWLSGRGPDVKTNELPHTFAPTGSFHSSVHLLAGPVAFQWSPEQPIRGQTAFDCGVVTVRFGEPLNICVVDEVQRVNTC